MMKHIEQLQARNLEIKRQYENLAAEKTRFMNRINSSLNINPRKKRFLQKQMYALEDEMVRVKRFRTQCKIVITGLIEQAAEYYQFDDSNPLAAYRRRCYFKFDDITKIKGYDLLLKHGWYNRKDNFTGCVKDHRFSVKEGFDQDYDPIIIGHSANCEFMLYSDNGAKGKKCSISYKKLLDIIDKW